ncbi:MAG: hypothetical protein NC412_13525 [Roseburia sp.]|nr:hypothetical protein [Roseburia sp.]MCM1278369.1 hypothetical protein [Robinsoniella sp.]
MEYVVFLAIIIAFLAFIFVMGMLEERRAKKKFREKLEKDYGKPSRKQYVEGRLSTISGYYKKTIGETDFFIDDITWNDLDMDRLYQTMDYTFSAAGEEVLYKTLRCPSMEEGIFKEREEKINYFRENKEKRINVQLLFASIGRTGKYSIVDYFDYLDNLKAEKLTRHIAMLIGIGASLAGMFFEPAIGLTAFCILLALNIIWYFPSQKQIAPYITTFSYLLRIIKTIEKLDKCHVPVFEKEMKALKRLRKETKAFAKGAFLIFGDKAVKSNPFEILLDYIKMCFHIDILKFYSMLKEAKKHKRDFLEMFETIGSMEMVISIGAYRESLSYYCLPRFCDKLYIEGEEMYHPLVENPIANSFREDKGMLLTGSNASGKSTFLKTVAVNVILAQTIYTCMAKSFTSSIFRVYSSMSLKDDLAARESYFIVEIKALKRVIDAVKRKGAPVLCFVDEVLRGTNTVERIAASTEILESLLGEGSMCFAATHDIELTRLLEGRYHNFHFEETIIENDVKFNYKLEEGRATTRNAIQLLGVLQYDRQIIEKAEKRAERFVNTGKWT